MIEFKKSELIEALLTISSQKTEEEKVTVMGLLNEKITLGMKRRLQKMHGLLINEYNQYQTDLKDCKGDPKEIETLNLEVVKIDAEKVSLEMIDNIETSNNYSSNIIEKIAQ